MNNNYPNLMCFGRDVVNCILLEKCSKYQECEQEYEDSWKRLIYSDNKKE